MVAAGAYVPYYRLLRSSLNGGGGKGSRSVASYDEDTSSLGVEAARRALAEYDGPDPGQLIFATSVPAYADKTNATTLHAALGLSEGCAADDMVGGVRGGIAAMRIAGAMAAAAAPSLAVSADIRTGLPGSIDERSGGDGAVALVFGTEGPFLASFAGHGSATEEFLERWRIPGERYSQVWEERFGEATYPPLADAALARALDSAGIAVGDLDRLIVTGVHSRAVATVKRSCGVSPEGLVDDRESTLGITGAAHPGLLLVDALDQARPGELIGLLVLADGAECLIVRAEEGISNRRPKPSVAAQLEGADVAYDDFLVWRGMLRRQPPRRPDPDRPAAPASLRTAHWKFAFMGSRCLECGKRHLPPARICLGCHAADRMVDEPLSETHGKVRTFAIDHLAFSIAPPVVAAVIDLDGGGRLQCHLTDCDPDAVAVGDRVELTFRRLYTTDDGVHNYFWKARPLRAEEE